MSNDKKPVLQRIKVAVLIVFAVVSIGWSMVTATMWASAREMRQWPTATATASDHRVLTHRGGSKFVEATVTYVHPTMPGSPTCIVKNFDIGGPVQENAFRKTVGLAVRPTSCYQPGRLPIGGFGSFWEWVGGLLMLAGVLSLWPITVIGLGEIRDRIRSARQKTSAQTASPDPNAARSP